MTPVIHRPEAAAMAVLLALAAGLITAQGVRETAAAAPVPQGVARPAAAPSLQVEQPASSTAPSVRPGLARSVPTRLEIPSIGVRTSLLRLGLEKDGTVEVPPLARNAPAGWYEHSATPGETGRTVILGHVDSARDGPAVFYRLGTLKVGSKVTVHRADGSAVHFVVTRVARYPKDDFPTADVYGASATPVLRLVTCGGDFDYSTRSYRDNIVVSAGLK